MFVRNREAVLQTFGADDSFDVGRVNEGTDEKQSITQLQKRSLKKRSGEPMKSS